MSQSPSSPTPEKKSYKSTLNLPKTPFAMKANLVQNEPAALKRWTEQKLYAQIRQARSRAPRFVFHDGPPYANGSIHLGHLLNKVLKDFVVRSKTMAGFDVPYIPGWDCHGLPIEHKVMQDLGAAGKTMEPYQVRRKCRDSAEKFIKLQKTQMQRLLTVADYDKPYLTMDPAYEAAVLEVFADLVARGLVYRALKPVHWSIENRTALAEAELEYYDRQDTSVFVLFELLQASSLPASLQAPAGEKVHLMIWTTTPWTLPANLAVAVHERFEYGLYRFTVKGRTVLAIVATSLAEKVLAQGGATDIQKLGTCTGGDLVAAKATYQHPFVQRTNPVVTADYVTLEDGTGMVHTAPGHGVEDYQTGLKHGLEIYCPVMENGEFDDTVPTWLRRQTVWKGNHLVVDHLRESGHLFFDHAFTHSYPHDWRGKTPTIFRATEQWFISVNRPFRIDSDPPKLSPKSLRERALNEVGFDLQNPETDLQRELARKWQTEIQEWQAENKKSDLLRTDSDENQDGNNHQGNTWISLPNNFWWSKYPEGGIKFYPDWGRNRMRGMLETRPDWCVSRQRAWGLPIPAFFDAEGRTLLTAASVRAVSANLRAQGGSDYWFKATATELLAGYNPATDPDAPDWAKKSSTKPGDGWQKSSDIFDVWFESGSSWHAVMRQRKLDCMPDAPAHTDLYLEGSDQHRGWFQSSLLPSLGATGKPPFASVLTHGFMVDKDGRKMSKSLGNTLEVEELLKQHGADVCRWWVSSINTDNDIKVDPSFFALAGEEYRKVRNTIRFLLSNLYDFDPAQHRHNFTEADAGSLDAWAMGELAGLVRLVKYGYEEFNFPSVNRAIFNYCNDTLSAVYLAATKDRLYCDSPASVRRRRTQTAMWQITDALIRLVAPILPYTAEEAWTALHQGKSAASVHLADFPSPVDVPVSDQWEPVMAARSGWMKAIEDARASLGVDNPLDLELVLPADAQGQELAPVDLADLCMISRVSRGEKLVVRDLRDQPRCERSWKRDGTVKQRSDGGMLSDRDATALGLA